MKNLTPGYKKYIENRKWTKGNEQDYLNQLMSGELWNINTNPHHSTISKDKLLRNYIASAEKRIMWGTYVEGGEEVIDHARNLLMNLDGG